MWYKFKIKLLSIKLIIWNYIMLGIYLHGYIQDINI